MNYWSIKRQLQRADCRFLCSVYCFRKLVFSTWIKLTIVLKQSSEIIILKCFRIASFRLKSAKIFLGEGTPLPQTPTPSASSPRCATCGGDVAESNDCFDFAPPPPPIKTSNDVSGNNVIFIYYITVIRSGKKVLTLFWFPHTCPPPPSF